VPQETASGSYPEADVSISHPPLLWACELIDLFIVYLTTPLLARIVYN
jgi:hypothetical protein